MTLERSARGAVAGSIAAALWAAQQPLDKRAFRSRYDDLELLGKAVTRGEGWPLAGFAIHVGNGALFGAFYAQLRPLLPGPPVARAVLAAMAENFGTWPLGRYVDRYHPARKQLAPFSGNHRALAQSTWRHLVFGLVLGVLEQRLNPELHEEPPDVPAASNGHGDIEAAVGAPAGSVE